MHEGFVERLLVVARVVEARVLALALCNPQLKVPQLAGVALEDDVASDACFIEVGLVDPQPAQALECVVPDDGGD